MKTCLRCGKDFKRLDRHLTNQNPCKLKYLDLQPNEILKDYERYLVDFKKLLDEKYQCEYCNKFYKSQSSYITHRNHVCKLNPNKVPSKIQTTHDTDDVNSSNHGSNYNNYNNNGIINNTINNITNNVTNNNVNIENINNITYVLNNFGEEAPISVHELVTILNKCIRENRMDDILPMYVKKRWIENEFNRNVNVTDASRGIAEVYVNKEWEKQFLTDVIEKIRTKSTKDIRQYLIEVMKQLQEKHGEEYKNIPYVTRMNKVGAHMSYNDKLPEVYKKTDKNIKLELLNGRKKVRQTWAEIIENDTEIPCIENL